MSKAKQTPEDNGQVTSIDDEPIVVAEATTNATATEELHVADHGDALSGEKMELVINSGTGEAGKQAVFVGINGFSLNIPRDVKVIVPVEVVEQLENCMETQYESVGGSKVEEREVRRFAFSARPVRK